MAEAVRCADCAFYPWLRDAEPDLLPALRCHPDLPPQRWTTQTRDMERECRYFKPVNGEAQAEEQAPEPEPAQGEAAPNESAAAAEEPTGEAEGNAEAQPAEEVAQEAEGEAEPAAGEEQEPEAAQEQPKGGSRRGRGGRGRNR